MTTTSLDIESALTELVDKICPGLDSGNLLDDASTASKKLSNMINPAMGGRESVDDALAIVESFGPGIAGVNDTYARQILLAEEVKRLRATHPQASDPAQAAFDRLPMCGVKADGTCDQCAGSCMWFGKASGPAPSTAEELPPFNDPRVQIAYKILVDDERPPKGEHWEGFLARKIVAALLEAQPKREPLTEAEVQKAIGASDVYWAHSKLHLLAIARAIEAAHGITKKGAL